MSSEMTFQQRRMEELRLHILVVLAQQPDYTATDSLLHAALNEHLMQTAMADVRLCITWLNEEGLVVMQRAGGKLGFTMATVTERGLDVANGARLFPGVARKRPGA